MRYDGFTDEELAAKAQCGGQGSEAESVLIDRFARLAVLIAGEFTIPGLDLDDKVAEARFGLLKAVRGYRPGQGTKFKTFAKLAMRRLLIDRQREANQAGEIPISAMRSIDDTVGSDESMSLGDVLAGDDDPAGDVIARDEAIVRCGLVASAQWETLRSAVAGGSDVADRLLASVRSFGRELASRGTITADTYRDLCNLVEQRPQLGLFGIHAEGIEGQELARAIFEEYIALQWLILVDVSEGYEHAEIAERLNIDQSVVGQILAAIREQVQSTESLAMAA